MLFWLIKVWEWGGGEGRLGGGEGLERRKSKGPKIHEVCREGKKDANRKCPFSRVLPGCFSSPPASYAKGIDFTVLFTFDGPA